MTQTSILQLPESAAYQNLPPSTRVWIYQSDRPFSKAETATLKGVLGRFAENWVSHNRSLRAFGDVLYRQFILLMVDESLSDASGCSIDKSVHFLQQVERELGVNLFDRMTFAWLDSDPDADVGVRTAGRDEFARLYEARLLSDQTLVFDHLVKTKSELEAAWLKPLAQSWHRRMV